MREPTPAEKLRARKNELNAQLAALGVIPLQNWLDKASTLHPSLAEALEGIYCGEQGDVHQELTGELQGLWLRFGWYTSDKSVAPPRVEFVYLS